MKKSLTAILLAGSLSSAFAQDMQYDARKAQEAIIFRQLTYQTLVCMQQSATFIARSGQTDQKTAVVWMATMCGKPFHNYSVAVLGIKASRVEAVLISMAEDQLRAVPGLSLK